MVVGVALLVASGLLRAASVRGVELLRLLLVALVVRGHFMRQCQAHDASVVHIHRRGWAAGLDWTAWLSGLLLLASQNIKMKA